MNLPLFRKLKTWIRKHPTQFWMDQYFTQEVRHRLTGPRWHIRGHCQMAGCIAALALFLESKTKTVAQAARLSPSSPMELEARAGRALGVSCSRRDRLFHRAEWPEKFRPLGRTAKANAQRGIARINHFIKTGE